MIIKNPILRIFLKSYIGKRVYFLKIDILNILLFGGSMAVKFDINKAQQAANSLTALLPKSVLQTRFSQPPISKPLSIPMPRKLNTGLTSIGIDLDLSQLTLPTGESSVVETEMDRTSWMFFGFKRIGKSSLASKFPGSITFKFEIASQRVKSMNFDCPSWAHFTKGIELLKAEKEQMGNKWHRRIAVIDTPFEAYSRCKEHVCKKNGITYTSDDKAFGGIWDKISSEFRKAHMELQALGLGLIVVCHDEIKEQTTRAGQKFDMIMPKLPKQADDLYRAIIENVIYYHYRDKQRWMALRGSDYVFAGVIGDEDDKVFMTPNGEKISAVYAGETSGQAFQNLKNAFDCLQEETFEDESVQYETAALKKSITDKVLNQAAQKKKN